MVYRIGIVGGGLSGTLLSIQLLRRLAQADEVIVFEPRSCCGPGLAYDTHYAAHVLNVPAGKISIIPGNRDDFVEWLLASENTNIRKFGTADSFVPRQIFGDYVRARLAQSISHRQHGASFVHVRDDAVAAFASGQSGKIDIHTSRNQVFEVDHIALAMGNSLSNQTRHGFSHPWETGLSEYGDKQGKHLILGSGLTAVDTLLRLRENGFQGQITFLSRRGLLPRTHDLSQPENHPAFLIQESQELPISQLLAKVRSNARQFGWRTTIDGLRPMTQTVWRSMDDEKKRRFLRHLQTWWDVHRHRMSRETAQKIDSELENGTLRILKGRIINAAKNARNNWTVAIRFKGEDYAKDFTFSTAYDCTGPCLDLNIAETPLLSCLQKTGELCADPLGLGIAVNTQCQAITRDGSPSNNISVIGPLTRGNLWEITAAEEIRAQVFSLAENLGHQAFASQHLPASHLPTHSPSDITRGIS